MKTSPHTAIVMTLFATFFWASNFHVTQFVLSSVPPWTAAVERFLIAVIGIFGLLGFKEGVRWPVVSRNLVAFIVLGVIGVAGFNGALFYGLQTSSPITASLIMATTPISANIMEALLRREWPSLSRVGGILVSLFGVALVVTNGHLLSGAIHFAPGDLIIFCGSIGWATYTVGTRAWVAQATPLETTSWTMLFGTVVLGVVAMLLEDPWAAVRATSGVSWVAALWMGIAGSVLAYLFWNVGIAVRGPSKTAIFFNFVPLFALLISAMRGALPNGMQMVGATLTIIGVLLGQGALAGVLKRATALNRV